MGYILSRFDDVRIVDGRIGAEMRGSTIVLRFNDCTFELSYGSIPGLRDVLDLVEDRRAGRDLRPPSQEQAERWRKEEADAELMEDHGNLDVDQLERLIEMKRSLRAALEEGNDEAQD